MGGTDEDDLDPAAAALARAAALRAAVAEADDELDEDEVAAAPPPAPEPEPVRAPERAPVVLPEVNRDPFARANDALRAAREARGAEDDPLPEVPPLDRRNPLAAAEAALARAREAQASVKGRKTLEREARARAELARLKGGGSAPTTAATSSADEPTEHDQPTLGKPKPRRL